MCPAITMNSTGIHQRSAHIPKPGIALLHNRRKRSHRQRNLSVHWTHCHQDDLRGLDATTREPANTYGRAGFGGIAGTRPPAVDAECTSPAGASPQELFTVFQSGTVGSGHNRTPITGRPTAISAVYRSVRAQMSTGRRTSCVDWSLSLSRIVTGNGMVVARRKLITT